MKRMSNASRISCNIGILIAVCLSGSGSFQASSTQQMPTSPPEKKQIVIESVYNYALRQYRSPSLVNVMTVPSETGYKSPESTVQSHISAMMTKNWEWFLQGWTPESANEIEQENKKKGVSIPSITSRWDELVGKKVNLISRIETGQYVVIVYELQGNDGRVSRSFAPMKFENSKWLMTNDLRDDPLLTAGLNLKWTSEGRAVVTNIVR